MWSGERRADLGPRPYKVAPGSSAGKGALQSRSFPRKQPQLQDNCINQAPMSSASVSAVIVTRRSGWFVWFFFSLSNHCKI